MFERFTDRARRALERAQQLANEMGHPGVAPEHLLVALSDPDVGGLGGEALTRVGADHASILAAVERVHPRGRPTVDPAVALAAVGIDVDALRSTTDATFGMGALRTPQGPPFTDPAKRVLEGALRASLWVKTPYMGTEHLLMAVVAPIQGAVDRSVSTFPGEGGEVEAVVAAALADVGVEPERVTDELATMFERLAAATADPWLAGHQAVRTELQQAVLLLPPVGLAVPADSPRGLALAALADTVDRAAGDGTRRLLDVAGPVTPEAIRAAHDDLPGAIDEARRRLDDLGAGRFVAVVPVLRARDDLTALEARPDHPLASAIHFGHVTSDPPLPEPLELDLVRAVALVGQARRDAWVAVYDATVDGESDVDALAEVYAGTLLPSLEAAERAMAVAADWLADQAEPPDSHSVAE